jgi:transposase
MQMDKEQYGKAKACLVSCMQEGYSWQVAKAVAGLQISQSSAYRLWRAFRQCGEVALSDRRHGHPSKLRGAARAFLEERCRRAPQTPSSTIQMELRERFDLRVSISQINRVRAAFGASNHANCSLLRSLQRYFLTFKQPFRQVSSPVIHHCVLPTVCLQPCAVSY